MYKFIMVDDEAFMLEELSQIMEWESIGFELSAIFTDSSEAVEYLETNHVDVILSDIKMPLFSGIDLAKLCYEKYPEIIIVFISAHRDFEYARTAIQYNVSRYLLKPISYLELENTFLELRDYLNKNKNSSRFLDEKLILNRQELFSNIVSGIPVGDIVKKLNDVNIFSNPYECPALIFDIVVKNFTEQLKNVWKYGKDSLYNAISRFVLPEDSNSYYSILNYSFNKITVIAFSKNKTSDLQRNVTDFMHCLKDNLKNYLELEAQITVVQIFNNLSVAKYGDYMDGLIDKCVKTIVSLVANEEISETKELIDSFFNNYKKDFELKVLLYKKLCVALKDFFGENILLGSQQDIVPPNDSECHLCVMNLIEKAADSLKKNSDEINNTIISSVIEYVNEHYDEDITLASVSRHVAFNPNYFSSYFKKHTNEKFVDFLMRFRMEKAKELLSSKNDISVQYVCDKVGYNSIPHFYKVFREYTGLTPAEYRKIMKKRG